MMRIAGAILTLLVLCFGGLDVAFNSIMMTRHARVDSEVGVTVYGMQMIISSALTIVCTAFASGLWWAGIRHARRSKPVRRWEIIANGLVFYPSALLAVVILGYLAYRLTVMGGQEDGQAVSMSTQPARLEHPMRFAQDKAKPSMATAKSCTLNAYFRKDAA